VTEATIGSLLVSKNEENRDVETQEPCAAFKARLALKALKGQRTVA
jgi:hypothetical protein